MATNDRVNKIIQKIEEDAESQAEEIINEAKEQVEEIKQRAREIADDEKQKVLDKGKRQAKNERERIISSAKLEGRKIKLEAREELINQVINEVKQRLEEMDKEDYRESLYEIIRNSGKEIEDDKIHIQTDELGKEILKQDKNKIEEEIGKEVEIEGDEFDQKGLVIKNSNKTASIDKRLGNIVERKRSQLRKKINQKLFG